MGSHVPTRTGMHVNELDVTGFRGVKECEEPLDLSPFTILVGRNNAGKSSLLEALYTVFAGQDSISGEPREEQVRMLHDSQLSYRYAGSGRVTVDLGENRVIASFDEGKMTEVETQGEVERTSQSLASALETPRGYEHLVEITSETTTMLFSPSYESYNSVLDRLRDLRSQVEIADVHTEVAEFVNEQVDDEYTELYLETLEARKRPKTGSPFYVDIADLGSGVLKTIAMYLAVETFDPAVLVWDDMGTSLHPGLLAHVMEWLAEKDDLQVVASTHSIDALSTFLDVGVENGSVVQVSKSSDDVVSHTTLDMAELELVMDNAGLDPRFLTDEFDLSSEVEA